MARPGPGPSSGLSPCPDADPSAAEGGELGPADANGTSPLARAVERGHVDEVRALLGAGADPDRLHATGYSGGKTLLHLAAEGPHAGLEVCRLLLEAGADPNARLLTSTDRLDLLDNLMPTNTTPLHLAASAGRADVCALLLKHGAQVGLADGLNTTALHLAAAARSLPACQVLIHVGAPVGALDVARQSPLHSAALGGAAEVCALLLRTGARVNQRDLTGTSPLQLAALNHHHGACQALLDAGADPNLADDVGNTPLHGACYLIAFLQHTAPDAVATLRALLRAGADPNVPFPFGTKTVPDMLQPYPSAMAAYAGLLAEMRSEALEAAWPPVAQPAGRHRL